MTTEPELPPVVRLGAGLTQLGRPWGIRRREIPTEEESERFLIDAIALGIRVFDSAPSYGASEERLGRFLRGVDPALRRDIVVATKFGERWDPESGNVVVDHSYDALARSLELSLRRLPHIDVIQLHRTEARSLRSNAVRRAFELALSMGVAATGVSASRVEDVRMALEVLGVSWVQFPFHMGNAYMEEAFILAAERGCSVLVNRPFGMGALMAGSEPTTPQAAFSFILERHFRGAILTGTASIEHLRENAVAFADVTRRMAPHGDQ